MSTEHMLIAAIVGLFVLWVLFSLAEYIGNWHSKWAIQSVYKRMMHREKQKAIAADVSGAEMANLDTKSK